MQLPALLGDGGPRRSGGTRQRCTQRRALVDRVAGDPKKFRTLTADEMFAILDHECRDRHLWALALYGLRRGEVAGLRWEHVDLTAQTVSIVENRVVLGKQRSNRHAEEQSHHAGPFPCPTTSSRC